MGNSDQRLSFSPLSNDASISPILFPNCTDDLAPSSMSTLNYWISLIYSKEHWGHIWSLISGWSDGSDPVVSAFPIKSHAVQAYKDPVSCLLSKLPSSAGHEILLQCRTSARHRQFLSCTLNWKLQLETDEADSVEKKKKNRKLSSECQALSYLPICFPFLTSHSLLLSLCSGYS